MSAKYLLSYCVKPLYLMDNIDESKSCGLVTGILYASIITFLLVAYITRLYLIKSLPYPIHAIQALGLALIILWWFIPGYYTIGYANMWKGYNDTYQELLAQGYTRFQILTIFNNFSSSSSDVNGVAVIPGIGNLATEHGRQETTPSPSSK